MNRVLFIIILVLPLFAVSSGSVSARMPDPQPGAAMRLQDKIDQRSTVDVARLKKKADREIDRRTEALKQLVERITKAKKLSDSQKSSLTSQVEAEISSLAALKVKIEADTDVDTLRADVKSIVASYRVYALFMPMMNIIAAADKIMETADNLDALANKVAEKTKDTSVVQSVKERTDDARDNAKNAANMVTLLTPEGYPDNKKELMQARETLSLARNDLAFARSALGKVLGEIKKTP